MQKSCRPEKGANKQKQTAKSQHKQIINIIAQLKHYKTP